MKKPSASVMKVVRQQARHSRTEAPPEDINVRPATSVWVPEPGQLVMEQILGTRIPTKELRLVIQPNPYHGSATVQTPDGDIREVSLMRLRPIDPEDP